MKRNLWILSGVMLVAAMAAGGGGTTQLAAQSTTPPTFNKDVAPIIFGKCVKCHRPNQIAPMSLMSYKEVRPWARAIKDKTMKGEMPPWFADARFGEFKNDPRLTDAELKAVAAWADAGAPQGDGPLMAELPKVNDGWSHPSGRDPDLVITMAHAYDGPAEGEVPWFNIYQEIPEELKKQEHFVEAIQILPGVISAMHHTQFGIKPIPKDTRIGVGENYPGGQIINGALIDEKTGKLAAAGLAVTNEEGVQQRDGKTSFSWCCYVPGGNFRQYQNGGFQRIPKLEEGMIVWGMHYTMIGKPFSDKTKVGFWFQKDPRNEITGGSAGRVNIANGRELADDSFSPRRVGGGQAGTGSGPAIPVIPPHTADWPFTAISAYQDDVTLYTVWAHMHIRGKEMTFLVTFPDGREQIVMSNLKYNYNWQLFYDLKEPLKIPAGSTVKAIGSYDNSVRNKYNTQPHKEVYWSEQAWDEMYSPFRDVSVDKNELVVSKTPASKPATAGGGGGQ